MSAHDYDVAIVGGSIAGCTAATLLGRRGARVALIERAPALDAYKTMCTHFIQPSAVPTIERLGLATEIEAAGGLRNGVEFWTRYGWVRPEPGPDYPYPAYGYDIQRKKLDPMLRRRAGDTAGVEVLMGRVATGLAGDPRRPRGVVVSAKDGDPREIRAKMVIGADGRGSSVARWARVPGRVKPHGRFGYFAYYSDLPLVSGEKTLFWFLDPDVGYAFPQDDGLTLMATFQTRDKLESFKGDLERNFEHFFAGLPRAPDLSSGKRVSKILGKVDMPNVYRPAAQGRVAFVGDAALAADPLWGVGCGWAFQSAEWLAEEIGDALVDGGDLETALARYRKRHRRWFLPQHLLLSDYATGRPLNPLEKLLFSVAAKDERAALDFYAFGGRNVSPMRLVSPGAIARAVRVRMNGSGSTA